MTDNIKCVRCGAYLFDGDDVVFCPECGAPHHRECYSSLGHCALEEAHGTDNEYSKITQKPVENTTNEDKTENKDEKYVICNNCKEKYLLNNSFCPKCSAPNPLKFNGFAQFDFLGGVPADYIIEDGVTAEEAKKYVSSNTHRYIPKFTTLNVNNKISWNWVAFFFPFAWSLSRKMFKSAFIFGFLQVIFTLFLYPFTQFVRGLGIADTTPTSEIISTITNNISNINIGVLILYLIGFFAIIGLCLVAGLFGDYIYKKHTVRAVNKIKTESTDIENDLVRKGGFNMFLFFLGYIFLNNIPQIIMTLL